MSVDIGLVALGASLLWTGFWAGVAFQAWRGGR